ncbi:MAG: ribose-phosphate pyrophosphokinase [Dehalococcoidales bacterium]|jgi:ribose-phosphate pyrophosphokinase|nr:ribose-phosphate pyrophosphokinase [Dehalococcoidales bacterium]MDP7110119.1 ribose-phosphate pyrophosphokinase [Dehalococcoidales bacterium]MDP7310094.1 ribose-phosphate pyrophosphokinase [Dehalococcoidales bacterium]MDP7409616.1 ribose-phosphate pyrophosphokinase [Dehalococcoidales bacterium]MDP7675950.1 ribose-phosphate pyrophosphokinase [Dehalococcoidales bacterium]
MDELKIFTGNAHPALAQSVCDYLDIPLGKCETFEFSNENIFVRILDNVRQRDVFVIQPFSSPVNKNLVELLIILDALKRASAGRITAVVPYYAYGRTDKKDQPRVPITARLIADLLTVAGANRLLTVDLHTAQIQGFFNIPVDELTALYLLSDYFRSKQIDDLVVVATDIGISKRARDFAARLKAPLAIMEKRRLDNAGQTETLNVIGDVKGKVALTVDDEIDTSGSLVNTVTALTERGVTEVYACCTHPVLSGPAIQRITTCPVKEIIVTDTLHLPDSKRLDNITVLPIAALLGEAIHRIHTGQSVGAMFQPE